MIEFLLQTRAEIVELTLDHFVLVGLSIFLAVAIGLPVGVLMAYRESLSRPILVLTNLIQTVPSLALFGFLIPIPFIGGIGTRTAIVALTLYSLLPIIRSTYTGIVSVDSAVREAAVGMGMTAGQILWRIELPLALGIIFSGIRIATVIAVGLATIAAAIGAGGLGMFIFRGVSMLDHRVILAGAIPAAVMALLADLVLGQVEKKMSKRAKRGSRH